MIIGVGIDIVDIHEIEESLREEGFQRRVFTVAELDSVQRYRNQAEHLAGKFAAKEAFMKAIGAGLGQSVTFTEIELLNNQAGKPCITIGGEAKKRFDNCDAKEIHLSISHASGVAVAVVILES
jgi:holo-[acyl-carrier protein] synthase